MIDPALSLSFSLQANRGIYAVLLGSGVSRTAKIPTGWEITLDLVRKLAAASGQDCGPSPESWYRDQYGKDPDYSELLDALAKTAAERQQLLKSYWEPTEQEREDGAKTPTQAHKAIASLVAKGFIKVIITTNFDRLMEMALAEVGVVPTVLSTTDQIQGSLPLVHTSCCLFKVHGDYLDTRIRNTPEELANYPEEFNRLLDRIFDEFGLIVCGWSADWDPALRDAITRCPSRRFTTYWATKGDPGKAAQTLIHHRSAQPVPIQDADSFFCHLYEQVIALERFSRPHPLSTDAAVATLKRYLSEDKYRIQLEDLINGEVKRITEGKKSPRFSRDGEKPDAETFTARVQDYEALCETLTAIGLVAGAYSKPEHYPIWQRALKTLCHQSPFIGSSYSLWLELEYYPSTLFFYAFCLGAIQTDNFDFIQMLFETTIKDKGIDDRLTLQCLPPFCLLQGRREIYDLLKETENQRFPLNNRLHDYFLEISRRTLGNDSQFTFLFDKFEILIALSFGLHRMESGHDYWVPPGPYAERNKNYLAIIGELKDSLAEFGDDSPLVKAHLFGKTTNKCQQQVESFEAFTKELRRYYRNHGLN